MGISIVLIALRFSSLCIWFITCRFMIECDLEMIVKSIESKLSLSIATTTFNILPEPASNPMSSTLLTSFAEFSPDGALYRITG